MMNCYRHFALTLDKRMTVGIDHPLEQGFLGACAACHKAGEMIVDANGKPTLDKDGAEMRVPLHSLMADGCMQGVRYDTSPPRSWRLSALCRISRNKKNRASCTLPFARRIMSINNSLKTKLHAPPSSPLFSASSSLLPPCRPLLFLLNNRRRRRAAARTTSSP